MRSKCQQIIRFLLFIQPVIIAFQLLTLFILALPASPSGGATGAWVRVDRCHFQAANRTLDTRLTFPDLTISGRVRLQPRAGHQAKQAGGGGGGGDGCTMILRLRQAGIEFRTVPLRQQPPSAGGQPHLSEQRSRRTAPSVRTDSYFAQPGFVSVFAHGCDALLADAAEGGAAGAEDGLGGYGAQQQQQRRPHRRKRRRFRVPVLVAGGGGAAGRGHGAGEWGTWESTCWCLVGAQSSCCSFKAGRFFDILKKTTIFVRIHYCFCLNQIQKNYRYFFCIRFIETILHFVRKIPF